MMKTKNLIFLAIFLFSITACNNYDDFEPDQFNDEDYDEYFEDDEDQSVGEEGSLTLYEIHGSELSKVKDFDVSGNLKEYQEDYDKHLKMWDFIKRLVPEGERERISEFMVFYGADDLAGYVEPVNENDLSKWRFGLAIELANNIEEIDFKDFFTYVTIHELGHIVTLKETQVDVNVSENQCGTYFPGEGCARNSSYINKLFDLGWMDIYEGEESNTNLYSEYPERFVSDYAATNPAEDIAEVFSFFVTQEDPPSGNSIADQKINLLYSFPELVELRNNLRGNPALRALTPGAWLENPLARKFKINCNHHHQKTVAHN